MSGRKYGEWSVEANLERERRIGAELRTSIDNARRALNTLQSSWVTASKKYGTEFPGL